MSIETPMKSSGNTDGGLVKKLKEFDGLAISVGNGKGDSTEHGTDHKLSDRFLNIRRTEIWLIKFLAYKMVAL